ncbi:MAG TPA: F0F1 ATP synthase subunit delta [Hyphomicrobiaceae bacterium]|nr:F0F1 ATP synthase subunit delta [Hyphomicrobiaceae bacterium]
MASEDSTTSGVAGRYASALFELAKDQNKVAEVENGLNTVQKVLDTSEDFTRMVRNPVFSADDQSRALAAVNAKVGVTGLAANFVQVLARNRRLFALPEMIRAFREIAARDRGEVMADVASAHTLSEAQMKSLAEALKASVGKDVKIQAKVDPSLLGGLVVKVGSRMLDNSLKTKLNALKVAMKGTG